MPETFRVFKSHEFNPGDNYLSISPDGRFKRTLIHTGFIAPHQDPVRFLKEFVPSLDSFEGSGKIVCIGSKTVSILQGRYRRKSDITPGIFARFASRYGTRTASGTGVAGHPEKLQVAIEEVGMARIGLAAGVSALEKLAFRSGLLRKRLGLFFVIAGKSVEAIDGLTEDGGYNNHVILCPDNYISLPDQLEQETGLPTAIVDINYIGGSVMSVSRGSSYAKREILSALSDNPFGQGKSRTPLIIIGRA